MAIQYLENGECVSLLSINIAEASENEEVESNWIKRSCSYAVIGGFPSTLWVCFSLLPTCKF